MPDRPKTFRERLVLRFFHLFFLATRPMTLGVRAIVIDGQDRVFLVRHTYIPAGTCRAAASRRARRC